ncbi:hypothetical protein AB0H88_51920 [Nonomuraea sp. NPDC050680]|uniref:hypothetical protein n=1 Tax=Nonomuraea sp. NPDC050680 TaxID=3154630 RepID=UPI0034032CDB
MNVAIYVAFLQGADLPIVGSVRGATGAILLLGMVGGCALSAPSQTRRLYMGIASTLGIIALAAGVVGLIMGSELLLAMLFSATVALWLIATVRHAFGTRKVEVTDGP